MAAAVKTRTVVLATTLALAGGLLGAPPATAIEAYSVTVEVVTQGGTPIAGQWVDVSVVGGDVDEDYDGTFDGSVGGAATMADGSVTFPAVPEGDYTVTAVTTASESERFKASVTVSGGPTAVSVTETHVNAISGVLRDSVTHAPIVGGWASIESLASPSVYSAVQSGPGGRYTLLARPGSYRHWYSAYRHIAAEPAAPYVVTDGVDVNDADASLYAESVLSGKVTLLGKGRQVGVDAAGKRITTTATGAYSEVVDPGTSLPVVYGGEETGYFTTYLGSTVRKPDAKKLVVTRGRSNVANIALVASATISGTVVDRKGRAAAWVTVTAQNLDRSGSVSATSDAKGRYTLRGLASGRAQVWASGGTDQLPASGWRTVTATQGKTVKSVKLTLGYDGIIYGQVKTSGSKATKQDVSLLDANGDWYATYRPDSQGWVGFAALPAGTYYVHVDGSNTRKKVTIKAHKQVSFGTISRGRQVTVKGVVRTAAGKPAKSALVTVSDRYGMVYAKVRTNSHGVYSVKAAVSGAYTITAKPKAGSDGWTRVGVTVKKGKSLAKNLRFAKGAAITGTVLNARGKPAIGVRVETLDGRSAKTNSSGVYTITGARAGRTDLRVSDPTYVGGYRNAYVTATAKAGKTVKAETVSVR